MRSRKGVMFTLVTVVVVVLLLGEVLTYIYTNTQYSDLGVQASPSLASTTFYSQIQSGMPAFLQSSLADAMVALSKYETSSTDTNGIVNNGAYALESLMENGTIYGVNMTSNAMGGLTLQAYANTLKMIGQREGLAVSLSNYNVIVFQNSSSGVSASLLTTLSVTSTYGSISYPIVANATVAIAGSPDLLGANLGTTAGYTSNKSFVVNSLYLSIASGSATPSNVPSSAVLALTGSMSPYLFAVGPLFVDNSAIATCSDVLISNVVGPSNYILVTPNAAQIPSSFCGFAGLVTYAPNTITVGGGYIPQKPFLIYNSLGANVISYLRTGGKYILDSNTLALYNPSALQSAVSSQNYFASSAAPTFLSLVGGPQLSVSPFGDAALSIATRQVASISAGTVTASTTMANTASGGLNTVSFWVQWPTSSTNMAPFGSNSYSIFIASNQIGISSNNGANLLGVSDYGLPAFNTTPWINVVAVLNNTVATSSNDILYIDGVRQVTGQLYGSFSSVAAVGNTMVLGGITGNFVGQMADVQVYNSALTPYQAESIYLSGINGGPANSSSLIGWWPLKGSTVDYGPFHNNGIATASGFGYSGISGYAGDTLDGGSFYHTAVSGIQGISQCYSYGACAWSGTGKIYVPIQPNYTGTVTSAGASLGLLNNTLPASVFLNGQEWYKSNVPGLSTATSETLNFWMECTGSGGTAVSTGGVSIGGSCSSFSAGGATATPNLANHWVDVIAAIQSGSDNIYINGSSAGSGGSSFTAGNTIYIGSAGGSTIFQGSIADVQVYKNLYVTATQAEQLYLNNTPPGYSPAGWWAMNSDGGYNNQTGFTTGNVAYEYTGTSTSCTAANAIAFGSPCYVQFLPFGPR